MTRDHGPAMGRKSLTGDDDVKGYAPVQIALHWIVVVIVAFQYFAHAGIEQAWKAHFVGGQPISETPALAYLHVAAGSLVLVLALLRIALRITHGAPPPPHNEPRLLQFASEAVHAAIYILLLLLPLSGMTAWFIGAEVAGDAHSSMTGLLLAAIALHIAGALFQHFIRRSQVMIRMLRAQNTDG